VGPRTLTQSVNAVAVYDVAISSYLIFYSLKTVVRRNCAQSSYTYRYNKMLWRQILNNNNDIGSYKMQLCVQSSYTYTYNKMLW